MKFSKSGSVFTDNQMAEAMIDRLAHDGYLLSLKMRAIERNMH
ncbi:hypothetical protein [Peribacillus frigoritolerans]